jgi:hypothetical protein
MGGTMGRKKEGGKRERGGGRTEERKKGRPKERKKVKKVRK